jgi:hypothetical protein
VGLYLKLPSVLTDFRDNPCIRSGQAGFCGAIKETFLAERGFFLSPNGCGLLTAPPVGDQSVPDGIREVVASNNEFKCRIRPR